MYPKFRQDLTTYHSPPNPPLAHVLSIGWVAPQHAFAQGESQVHFIRKLEALYLDEVQGTRVARVGGEFDCPFGCLPERLHGRDGRWAGPFGIGELWVPSDSFIIYCAPGLLIHYIQKHSYQPPECFVNVVLAIDETTRFDAEIARMQSLAITKRGQPLSHGELVEMGFLKPADKMPWNKLRPPYDGSHL